MFDASASLPGPKDPSLLWNDGYLDGMTASEWVQWGKALSWLYGSNGKVNRNGS